MTRTPALSPSRAASDTRAAKQVAKGNLGQTRLPKRRSSRDPMRSFDSLPPALRGWVAQAALPWSPSSCLRLWQRALSEGLNQTEALRRLDQAEGRLLRRDAQTQTQRSAADPTARQTRGQSAQH